MNEVKVGLCFLDAKNKPIVIKPLESNWLVKMEGTDRNYRNKVIDEICETLSDGIKIEIKPNILKEMIEEMRQLQ